MRHPNTTTRGRNPTREPGNNKPSPPMCQWGPWDESELPSPLGSNELSPSSPQGWYQRYLLIESQNFPHHPLVTWTPHYCVGGDHVGRYYSHPPPSRGKEELLPHLGCQWKLDGEPGPLAPLRSSGVASSEQCQESLAKTEDLNMIQGHITRYKNV